MKAHEISPAESPLPMKKIGFVLPFYNEEAVLEQFHAALATAVEARKDLTFEFIYVDDGSSDLGYEKLLTLRGFDPRITILKFAKNFGHELANTAGLDYAHELGVDAVCIMDTDLQDPPPVAMAMIERWESGVDVVYGQRRKRHRESQFQKLAAHGFYWTLAKLAETAIPPHTSDFRVFDRRVLATVVQYRERDRFLRGIISDVGFTQEPYLFDRAERAAGKTHYNLRSLLKLAGAAIFGFSTYPLKMITRLGVAVSMISVIYALFVVGQWTFNHGYRFPGWTFSVASSLFLAGIQMIMLGVIGHYVGRIYKEALQRPLYIIESVAHTKKIAQAE